MAYRPDLDRLLTPGAVYHLDDLAMVIERHPVDSVVLPTGQIVGCDPLAAPEREPFEGTVAPGVYPMVAWVGVLHRDGQEWDRRVAALQLAVRDEPAARWEMAMLAWQDEADLDGDEFFGYPVDAGAGTLADVVAVRALSEWDYERLEDVYIPAQLPMAPVPAAISAVTDEATGANVATVSSGWGDGAYPTFIGYTAAGEVACFVTDFLVAPPPDVTPG